MTTRTKYTPGAMRAAQMILDGAPESAVEAAARIIDRHTGTLDLVAALKECEAFLWAEIQEAGVGVPVWNPGGEGHTLHEQVKAALAKTSA